MGTLYKSYKLYGRLQLNIVTNVRAPLARTNVRACFRTNVQIFLMHEYALLLVNNCINMLIIHIPIVIVN